MSDWYVEAANHTCGDYDAGVNEMGLTGLTPEASLRVCVVLYDPVGALLFICLILRKSPAQSDWAMGSSFDSHGCHYPFLPCHIGKPF